MNKVNRNRTPSDGLGWLWDYTTRLVATYPSFTRDFVLYELPMIEGFAWLAAAIEMNGWLGFCGIKRSGKGYVGIESERLYQEALTAWRAS
ncbi:MAG: hypothetical protein KGL39_10200 [Patescibacteria group bacterium]|nr:hypothetical protein [Patescibacteria group bacterium]